MALLVDLRSLKRFRAGSVVRFVLSSDFGGRVPDEETLREIARGITARLTTGGNPTTAREWVMSSQGWTGWLHDWRDLDDAEEWFTEFAASFARSEGKIIGGPRYRALDELDPRPTLAGHLYLTTSDMREVDRNTHGWFWGIDEPTTRYVCEQMLHWVHMPRATEWVATNAEDSFQTTGLEHAQSMTEMVLDERALYLHAALRDPLRYRKGRVQSQGLLGVLIVDPDMSWSDKLDQVRQILTWAPPRSDYGYIRHTTGMDLPLDEGATWPHIRESHVRYNRPLLTSFVPDAFGIQLLTDAHLERAHDLTNWDITPLAGGRHLVAARDLEAWFGPIHAGGQNEHGGYARDRLLPDDLALVAKARADFGGMILTPELIEKHNPWR